MATEKPVPDPEYARMLATLIRENLEELIVEDLDRYAHDYAHSVNNALDLPVKRLWAEQELLSIASQLEAGEVDPHQYEGMRGDIVLQNEELLYPIDGFLETTFYIARMLADFVWEKTIGDTRSLDGMLQALEAFVQMRTIESLAAFSEEIARPRTLLRTWQLGRRWATRTRDDGSSHLAQRRTAPNAQQSSQPTESSARPRSARLTEGAPDLSNAAAPTPGNVSGTAPMIAPRSPASDSPTALLNQLTARELEMARLVAEGKSNNEVASALGLQLSTVRNTLSRIYMKLGIASRSELIVALARTGV